MTGLPSLYSIIPNGALLVYYLKVIFPVNLKIQLCRGLNSYFSQWLATVENTAIT